MIWVIQRRSSRAALRSIGDAMAMFSTVCFIILHPAIIQQNKNDFFLVISGYMETNETKCMSGER